MGYFQSRFCKSIFLGGDFRKYWQENVEVGQRRNEVNMGYVNEQVLQWVIGVQCCWGFLGMVQNILDLFYCKNKDVGGIYLLVFVCYLLRVVFKGVDF